MGARPALIATLWVGLAWTAGCADREAGPASAQGVGESVASEPDEPPPHTRIDLPSIAACGGCHLNVFEEWSESLHAKAWTNANVRAATDDFAQASCRPCHSPLPVLPKGLRRPPDFRDFNHSDGVHCLSCHGLADGVAAARTIPDAPCRPRLEPRLLSADLCWPCHQPTHHAFEEYESSDAFAVGLRCVDCHMQPRSDGSGRSHGPNGGLNPDFVRTALASEFAVEGDEVRVTLRNRAGHKFPGEIPSRSFLVRVEFEGAEPEVVLLRKPFRGEARADDRLLPDEQRTLRFQRPQGAGRAQIELLFKPLPLLPDAEAFVLATWSEPTTR